MTKTGKTCLHELAEYIVLNAVETDIVEDAVKDEVCHLNNNINNV